MRKLLGMCLILWACTACGSAVSQAEEEPVDKGGIVGLQAAEEVFLEAYFEALKQKALENYNKALVALERCLEIDDSEPAVYHELGKIHHLLGNYDRAAKFLKQARVLAPKNQLVLLDLYKSYVLSHQFEEALEVAEELSQVNQNYREDLAHMYFVTDRYDAALELLDQLDEQLGYHPRRTGLRRQIYAVTDNVEGKIADLKKRISQEPREERHYLNLIFIYVEADQQQMAFDTAEQLLELNPSSEMVHLALYKFYLDQDRFDSAMESMRTLLQGRELEDEVRFEVLNDVLLHLESHGQGQERLEEVVKLFAQKLSTTQVHEEVGDFYLGRHEYYRALEYYGQALSEKISSPELVIKALLLQTELHAYQDVIELSSRGLERFPTHPFMYLLQGTAYNGTGEHQLALDRLQQGLTHLDNDPELEVAFYEQMVVATRAMGAVKEAAGYARSLARLKLKILDE